MPVTTDHVKLERKAIRQLGCSYAAARTDGTEMNLSPWDTSGPSAIGVAFYSERIKKGKGQAPNLTRQAKAREPKPAKAPKPVRPPLDVAALQAYIRAGHTVKEAAAHFGRSEKGIRLHAGPVKQIRPCISSGREPKFVHGRYMRFNKEQWEFLMANGGSLFLRKLIDNARGQA